MRRKKEIQLKLDEKDRKIGYVYRPNHPGPQVRLPLGVYQVALGELVVNYKGPPIYLEFTKEGELIGIEIIP